VKLTRLKITGFKSFVDPIEFLIEPGLTGVIGPNGCGKSNLVEALRWVMGESSHKSLRASGMDDVIFSGTSNRPARNMAEVTLGIDNSDRKAPSAFNDSDQLDVTRRIEREEGSTYRLNGREVRARDVQLLFADAATGARSPAMVRQGQISEIINAKPSARRRILEDAAGIAGLHGRRHEAELRLKAAEDNLARVDDVIKEIDGQIDGLKRQSKQAQRYKALSAEIRDSEAFIAVYDHRDAKVQVKAAEEQAKIDLDALTSLSARQAETAKNQAIAAEALPRLREAEATAAAALQRLLIAQETLQADEERARKRLIELERRAEEMERDLERSNALAADAERAITALQSEDATLAETLAEAAAMRAEAATLLAERQKASDDADAALAKEQAALAAIVAQKSSLTASIRSTSERCQRLTDALERANQDLNEVIYAIENDLEIRALTAEVEEISEAVAQAERDAENARQAAALARETENALRPPLEDAERKAQKLETEVATLANLLATNSDSHYPSLVDQLIVAKGFEAALGAVLGDDLEASTDGNAPAHWAFAGTGETDAPLPSGIPSLADFVQGPKEIARLLRNIGVVDATDGARLRASLNPGQILVSREGAVWRWDGFTAAADAPTPAARRLAEKNRLGDLRVEAEAARHSANDLRAQSQAAATRVKEATQHESESLAHLRDRRAQFEALRDRRAKAERLQNERNAKRTSIEETLVRLGQDLESAQADLALHTDALEALPDTHQLETAVEHCRAEAQSARMIVAEASASEKSLAREVELGTQRRQSIAREIANWSQRKSQSAVQNEEFAQRKTEIETEKASLIDAPDQFAQKRRSLLTEVDAATSNRKDKADALALAETAQREADREAKDALAQFMAAREEKVKSELRLESAKERLERTAATIRERFDVEPDELALSLANAPDPETTNRDAVLSRLEQLKNERERLGGVNLRADEELSEIETRKGTISNEQVELIEAIRRLRDAIGTLNKEGRERLLAAFEVVKSHFETLFVSLFGGGTARLELIESDDPLEAGLEILAHPPGKKPSTMSLLSGGEQALTAIALIFAVFLTNPSPICVLDEVDAPLDDANVERYCDLLNEMAKSTETRFVVITHNPITMARMNRLFGVTMAERGVSQLVSVDLGTAESYLKAS